MRRKGKNNPEGIWGHHRWLLFSGKASVGARRRFVWRSGRRSGVERVILEAPEKGWAALNMLTETAQVYFAKFDFAAVDRSEVPPDVTGSVEFQGASPVSSTVMRLKIRE